MDINQVLDIVQGVAYVVLGGLVIWFKTSDIAQKKLKEITAAAGQFIAEVEEAYKSTTTAGEQKFEEVVDSLYKLVPKPLKLFITEDMVREIVQSVFDEMKKYANSKLDEAVEQIPDWTADNGKVVKIETSEPVKKTTRRRSTKKKTAETTTEDASK